MNILFMDTETTGLFAGKNEMVQFSAIFDVNGKPKTILDVKLRPNRPELMTQEALEKQGRTIEEIMEYPDRVEGLLKISQWIKKCHEEYGEFTTSGYNIGFDLDFFFASMKEINIDYHFFKMMAKNNTFDTLYLAIAARRIGLFDSSDMKLETVANALEIAINSNRGGFHDSMYDTRCARALFYKLENSLELKPSEVTHATNEDRQ